MNQVAVAPCLIVVFLAGIGGCAVNAPVATGGSESGTIALELPACTFESDTSAAACGVRVFDGTALVDGARQPNGRHRVEVLKSTATDARIALYAAPEHIPVVRAVRAAGGDEAAVRLAPAPDTRMGFLAGVAFRKSEPVVDGAACGIEGFLAGAQIIINRVRASFTVTTDNLGSFVVAVPAGRYMVHLDGASQTVDVSRGNTTFVTVAVE